MKTKLAISFGKTREKTILILRGIFLMLFLFINGVAFSQTVDIRRTNAYIVDLDTKDTLSTHSSDIEAAQQLLNYKYKNYNVKMFGAVYEVDVNPFDCSPIQTFKIDTINIIAHTYGNVIGKNEVVLSDCNNLYIVSKDSTITIPNYSFNALLERETSWIEAKTIYKLIGTPFFFYESDSTYIAGTPPITKIRTFANKKHCIRHFIDEVEIIGDDLFGTVACNPGPSTYKGGSFRHTNSFPDLDRTIDHLIRLEAVDIDTGKVIGFREFNIPKL